MTIQKRRDEPSGESGYRGALPTRDDLLARIWVAAVIVIFLLIFLLSFAGLPGSLLPSATPLPTVSVAPSASGSGAASPSASASATAAPSP